MPECFAPILTIVIEFFEVGAIQSVFRIGCLFMHLCPKFIYFADNIIIFTLCIFYDCDIAYKVGIAMAVVLDNVRVCIAETEVQYWKNCFRCIPCESCSLTSHPLYLVQPCH